MLHNADGFEAMNEAVPCGQSGVVCATCWGVDDAADDVEMRQPICLSVLSVRIFVDSDYVHMQYVLYALSKSNSCAPRHSMRMSNNQRSPTTRNVRPMNVVQVRNGDGD